MRRKKHGLSSLLIVIVIVIGFGVLLWLNGPQDVPSVIAPPNPVTATPEENPIARLLGQGFGEDSTPLPTVAIPDVLPTIPTLAIDPNTTSVAVGAGELGGETAPIALVVTPTLPPPTPVDAAEATEIAATRDPDSWQPPALIPPLSKDPLGYDHYWFMRPLDANANNWVLEVYPYGTDGPSQDNPLRQHHGIDMSNRVGERVRAAAAGVVIWSADGRQDEVDYFQNSPSYGNVILIEHYNQYRGQTLYTLYGHLSAAFVEVGDIVEMGEVIGLVGNTGQVTGPHLHFEVRLDENKYGSTVNPVLWMVPYVGHGVIAGQVLDFSGNYPSSLHDTTVTVRRVRDGLTQSTTTTYLYLNSSSDINADPNWQENFVVADVPVGTYDVIAVVDGQRVVERINVIEGTTNWVELKPEPRPTDEPVEDES